MLDELFQDFRISVRGLLRTPLCPWGCRFKAEPNLCTKVTAPHCPLEIPNSDARFRKDWKTTRGKIRITGERRSASHAIL